MGIGVFTESFNGTGKSFLVSGPSYLKARYQSECHPSPHAQSEPDFSYVTWAEENGINAQEDIAGIVDSTLASLGLDAGFLGEEERATFDSDFALIGRSDPIEIGLRDWDFEYDFVVAAAAAKGRYRDGPYDKIAQPELYLANSLSNGRIASVYAATAICLAEDTLVCLRHALQQAGFECRYPTSAWTTAAYPALDEDVVGAAAERISSANRYMKLDRDERFRELYATVDGRASVIRTVQSIEATGEYRSGEGHLYAWTPYYSPTRDEVILLDPFELASDRPAWSGGELSMPPALIAQLAKAAPEGYLYPVPRDEHTEDWWASQQAKTLGRSGVPYLLVSEAEFTETTGIEVGRWPSADLDEESENDDNSSFRP